MPEIRGEAGLLPTKQTKQNKTREMCQERVNAGKEGTLAPNVTQTGRNAGRPLRCRNGCNSYMAWDWKARVLRTKGGNTDASCSRRSGGLIEQTQTNRNSLYSTHFHQRQLRNRAVLRYRGIMTGYKGLLEGQHVPPLSVLLSIAFVSKAF